MKSQINEYEIDQFLYYFDPEAYGTATKISQFLKKKDLKHFTDRLLILIADYRNENIIMPIIQFINFVVSDPKYIPGNTGFELYDIITSDKAFTKAIIKRFTASGNVVFKQLIIDELFMLDDFFTIEEINTITTQAIQKDFYLIQNILFYHPSNFNQLIAETVESKQFLSLWALLQYFIESGELEIEEYLTEITKIQNQILNEKVRQYREILKIYEHMNLDNRIEFNELETETIQNFKYNFNDFLDKILNKSMRIPSEKDIEEIIQELLINQ